jgi:hypothetical protein
VNCKKTFVNIIKTYELWAKRKKGPRITIDIAMPAFDLAVVLIQNPFRRVSEIYRLGEIKFADLG